MAQKILVTLISCIFTFILNSMANLMNINQEIKALLPIIYNKRVEILKMKMTFMDICKVSEWDCL